jgi:putative ATP-dependent endonuclease of the OLD family
VLLSIRIENYRSIKSATINFGSLGVLCGPNNVGKSNVLKAITTLLGPKWSPNTLSEDDKNRSTPGAPIILEAQLDRPLTKDYYGTPYSVHGLRLTWWGPDNSEFLFLDAASTPAQTHTGRNLYVDNATRRQLSALHVEALRDLAGELRASQWTILGRILISIRDSLSQDSTFVVQHAAHARALTNHVKGGPVQDLERLLNEELRGITGFSSLSLAFDPPDLMSSLKSLQISISEETGLPENPARELGQGLQSALVVALVRAYQRMSNSEPLLLIEEPEAYLHPQARRAFFEILRRVSGGGASQVICTTHSTEFVDLTHPEEIYAVRKSRDAGTRVTRGFISSMSDPERAQLKMAIEFNHGLREAIFARCAILCEGPSEEVATFTALRKIGRDCDSEGISVRNVGSKENLPFFLQSLRSLGIPALALFDTDRNLPELQSYHQSLNTRIESAAGDANLCWAADPNFELAHSIPDADRSKSRSALLWATALSVEEARRVFAPLISRIDAVLSPAQPGGSS